MRARAGLLVAALVAALALPPRVVDTDRFVTTDELFWMGRAGNFARALATGQLGQTFQSGHPGVTTMWAATLGMGPAEAQSLAGARREVSRREVANNPAFLPALSQARRAVGVATTIGIGATVWAAWQALGPGPALVGGVLLALDPFLLAHSRLVHIDALLAAWMSAATLALVARWSGAGVAALALAGLATGLALLSKAPALFLAAFAPLSVVVVRGACAVRQPRVWWDLAFWALLAVATYVALWPAVWVSPLETFGQTLDFIRDNANPAQAATGEGAAGAWYYPLAFVTRTTPLTLAGLALLAIFRPPGDTWRAVIALGIAAVGFGLAMTVAAKSFDRYLLPAFPPLDLLAGLGYWGALRRLRTGRSAALSVVVAATVALSVFWIGRSWPYVLTYANPLVGGPPFAALHVATGWGEGLDQVAAYLNRRPGAARETVGMPGEIYTTVLGSQFRGQVTPAEGADAGAYDHVVVYVRNLQLGERPAFFDQRYLAWDPTMTVSLQGVPYAWLYDSRHGAPVDARFGEVIELVGYGLDSALARPGRRLELRLRWRPLAPLQPDMQLSVELAGGDGAATRGALPLRPSGETWPSGDIATASYLLAIDLAAPAGEYVLVVRVLDQAGHPLTLTRVPALGPRAPHLPDGVALRGITVR